MIALRLSLLRFAVVIGPVASAAEAGIIFGALMARLEAVPFPIVARPGGGLNGGGLHVREG
jgi:hypothetical protein